MTTTARPTRQGCGNCLLTDEQVIEALHSPESNVIVAGRFGVSRQTICDLRRGKTYQHVDPKFPRQGSRSTPRCFQCVHYQFVPPVGHVAGARCHRCLLGFPEIFDEGPRYATLCPAFMPETRTK